MTTIVDPKVFTIYRIYKNDDSYIGHTSTTLERRFRQHKYAAKRGVKHKLYDAMRASPLWWSIEPLEHLYGRPKDVKEVEKKYMDIYNSTLNLNH